MRTQVVSSRKQSTASKGIPSWQIEEEKKKKPLDVAKDFCCKDIDPDWVVKAHINEIIG